MIKSVSMLIFSKANVLEKVSARQMVFQSFYTRGVAELLYQFVVSSKTR
jgi:hypothetical protein